MRSRHLTAWSITLLLFAAVAFAADVPFPVSRQPGNGSVSGGSGTLSLPLSTSNGGTGLNGLPFNGVAVMQGPQPFLGLLMGPDTFMQGGPMGSAAPPIITNTPTLSDHERVRTTGGLTLANVTGCGTSPTISGVNGYFQISLGSSPVPGCTVTFTNPFAGTPVCIAVPSVNPNQFTTLNPVMTAVDPGGTFVQILPQTFGADIGCETVTVECREFVS